MPASKDILDIKRINSFFYPVGVVTVRVNLLHCFKEKNNRQIMKPKVEREYDKQNVKNTQDKDQFFFSELEKCTLNKIKKIHNNNKMPHTI